MRTLLFPFFALWLLITNILNVADLFLETVLPAIPLPVLFLIATTMFFAHKPKASPIIITPLPHSSLAESMNALPASYQPYIEKLIYQRNSQLSTTERLSLLKKLNKNPSWPKETAYWQNVLQKQPQDKNVLLNLSELALFEGKIDQAQQLRNQAKALDPNNLIFAQQGLPE